MDPFHAHSPSFPLKLLVLSFPLPPHQQASDFMATEYWLNVNGCRAICCSMASLSGPTSMKKNDSPLPAAINWQQLLRVVRLHEFGDPCWDFGTCRKDLHSEIPYGTFYLVSSTINHDTDQPAPANGPAGSSQFVWEPLRKVIDSEREGSASF